MAIGVDQIYLSMTDPDTGEYLTANVYTVDGVYEADGVTLRLLSIGQVVMAVCLRRATDLESGYWYEDPTTGARKRIKGIIDKMAEIEATSEKLECLTEIENAVLGDGVNLKSAKLTYKGHEYTYYDFLTDPDIGINLASVPATANKDSSEFISELEAEMDSKNSFSQQTMIELQSLTNKRDQAYDMISNILRSVNQVLTATVNNM